MSSSPPQVDWIAVAIPLNNLNRQNNDVSFRGIVLNGTAIKLLWLNPFYGFGMKNLREKREKENKCENTSKSAGCSQHGTHHDGLYQ